MKQHLELMSKILREAPWVRGRNGFTKELFGASARYENVGEHFPVITTKRIPLQVVLAELICFVRGESDVREYQKLGCNIWNANADSQYWRASPYYSPHSLGRIYGVQWRDWLAYIPNGLWTWANGFEERSVDQLKNLIDGIKADPHGRRHIVTAWNPGELDQMCLPPCHILFQCNVSEDNKLSLMMYQRSCDMFLGNPFDISSYAFLMLIICHQTGLIPGDFIHHMGSVHIYREHLDAVDTQLQHSPMPLPKIVIEKELPCALEDYTAADFIFEREYVSHPPIKAPMVV